ncbi:MAG TPA: asparagine synthase (glutamine-hydrolyzing) [Blastocatellia bacterium]|nr:asparagine synthase (glutamine-hydrolyzing) [Blastocatellia bacterium]
MCGIAGTINFIDAERLSAMTDAQAHRGPDDRGVRLFPEERVGLGHRRLSILDLSPAGHEPMSNPDETIWITFNGEIYNFIELRNELEQQGCKFKSQTDTEVILRLYEREGTDCLKRLNGMFALAILDRKRKKVVLARDHFGIKPLYYYRSQDKLVFASEIKGILASGIYSPDINWQGVYDYFTYLYVPCPETMFAGIQQLPPAHFLEFDLRSNQTVLSRYWFLQSPLESNGHTPSYEESKRKLRELLTQSVERQMISDVPLGVFLSGGVDSPILTGLMAEQTSQPVKTFTVTFSGKDLTLYNEAEQARAVAQRFRTEHHEIDVDISEPLEMLELISSFDQPFGNPTFYLMHLISKAARPHVTVALCGAGGDELFAGYPRHRAIGLAKSLNWIPDFVFAGAGQGLGLLSDNYRRPQLRRARQFVSGRDKDFARQYVNWTYFMTGAEKAKLFEGTAPAGAKNGGSYLPSERIVRQFLESGRSEGNSALDVDMQTFLPDNVLEYTDKMSMSVSLEVRVPYLDYRVVEHAHSLPFEYKLTAGNSKRILKETFADLLPAENTRGPKKGFNFPLATWMRDRFDSYFEQQMTRERVQRDGLFNWDYIQTLRQQHRTGKKDNSYPLFSLIMFDAWQQKYMDGANAAESLQAHLSKS